jgi:hypothetical protein
MQSGIKTIHPNGTQFEYLPGYEPFRHPLLGWLQFEKREPACRITFPDGRGTIVFNSDFDHIAPLKPSKKDIF